MLWYIGTTKDIEKAEAKNEMKRRDFGDWEQIEQTGQDEAKWAELRLRVNFYLLPILWCDAWIGLIGIYLL
jgi:hypothetical protein